MTKLSELAAQLAELKDQKTRLEGQLAITNDAIKQLSTVDMPMLMEDMEEDGFRCPSGTVYLQNKLYANVNADKREEFHEWLRSTDNGDLVRDHVFPQTLTAFAKERIEQGKPLPDFVKVTIVPTANLRRVK